MEPKTAALRTGGIPPAAREGQGDHFYRRLVESLCDYVLVIDRAGTILFESPACARLQGAGATAAGPRSLLETVHPEDVCALADAIADMARWPGRETTVSFRMRFADGSWRWLEAQVSDQLADTALSGLVLSARDVTSTRRLEHQHRQAERFARFGFWRHEIGTGQFTTSDGLLLFMGYKAHGPVRDPEIVMGAIHPADRGMVTASINETISTRQPRQYRCRALAADGTYRMVWTEVFLDCDPQGVPVAVIGVCHDVTDRDRAEEALRQSEAQYRLLAERASDIISRVGPDGICHFASPAITRVLGYEPSEIVGQCRVDLVHPDDLETFRAAFSARTGEAPEVTVAYRFRHKSGPYVWLETTTRAIIDLCTDRPHEFIAVTRDISERKRIELDLMAARERAEAASRTKSRFLANMSHELRTPLNAILGFSDIFRNEIFGPLGHPKYAEYGGLIYESGSLLLDLITDILDMSKIEAGKYMIYREPIDLKDLIDSSICLVRQKAEATGLILIVELPEQMPQLSADRRAVKQIVLNLLSNAVKFTPKGGTVTVFIERDDQHVTITVRDSGIGIPPEALPRLTQPFEQVVEDPQLAKAGSGLGLALVKALTRLHQGHLEIRSELGLGTEVRVTLPLLAPPGEEECPAAVI